MQTILTVFYLAWLVAVLVVLCMIFWWLMRYIRRMEETMLKSRAASAEAALKSAEAVGKLAAMLEEAQRHA